jgi:hypothetical protein
MPVNAGRRPETILAVLRWEIRMSGDKTSVAASRRYWTVPHVLAIAVAIGVGIVVFRYTGDSDLFLAVGSGMGLGALAWIASFHLNR